VTRTHRTPVRNESKIGVKRDGTIVAFSSKNYGDAGRSVVRWCWLLHGPRIHVQDREPVAARITVMTNSFKYSSLRCTEHPNTPSRATTVGSCRLCDQHESARFRLMNVNLEDRTPSRRSTTRGYKGIQQATDRAGCAKSGTRPKPRFGQGSPRHRNGRALLFTRGVGRPRRAWWSSTRTAR